MNKEPQDSVENSQRSAKVAPPTNAEAHFSDETIAALREFGDVLEPIYRRLIAEGYVIRDGRIVSEPTIEHDNGNEN